MAVARVELQTTGTEDVEQASASIDRVRAAISRVSAGPVMALGGPFAAAATAAERLAAAARQSADAIDNARPPAGVTDELRAQVALEGKLIDLDAARVRKAAELQKASTPAGGGQTSAEGHSSGEGSGASSLGEAAGAAAAVAAVLAVILAAVAKVTLVVGEFAVKASEFRKNAVSAFESFATLGEAASGAAERTYDKTLDLAEELGIKREDAIAKVKQLLTSGLRGNAVDLVVRASADLSAVNGAGAGDELTNKLAEIKASGKVNEETLKSLARAGVRADEVIGQLATSTGKSSAAVQAALKAGQITADQAIAAIAGAVEKDFGGKAAEAVNTFDGQLGRLESKLFRLFDQVDAGPLVKVLKSIGDALDSTAGKALKGALSELGGNIFTALFGDVDAGAAAKDVIGGIAGVLRLMSQTVKMLSPLTQGFTKGLGEGFGSAGQLIEKVFGDMKKDPQALESLRDLFVKAGQGVAYLAVGVATLVGGVVAGIGVLTGLAAAIVGVVVEIEQFFTGLGADTKGASVAGDSLGSALGQGFVNGIAGWLGAAAQKARDLVSGAHDAGAVAQQSHSPSEAWKKLGGYAGEGYSMGFDKSGGRVETAAENMAYRAVAAGGEASNDTGAAPGAGVAPAAPAAAGAPAARSVTGTVINIGPFNITPSSGGGSGEEVAQSTAQAVRREVQAVMRELAG